MSQLKQKWTQKLDGESGGGKKHEICTAAFGGYLFRTYCFSTVALTGSAAAEKY